MDNALPVASLDKRSHRYDIFRLLIDDIFHNLFDVTFPFSTCYQVTETDITKIEFFVRFQQFLPMYVVSVHR